MAKPIVLFAVGSPLVVDLEETCVRLGFDIVAAVQNVDGPTYVSAALHLIKPRQLTAADLQHPFAIALGMPENRKKAFEEARRLGFSKAATVVDPTSVLARSSAVGLGVFINAGCVIGGAAMVGNFALINRGANVGHHAVIEDYATLGPGVVIAGSVHIRRGAYIGAGAVLLPEIEIGENATVGAGAVVTRPVAAGTVVLGNPARHLDASMDQRS